jgi:predicted O-methyltransferase YrrM
LGREKSGREIQHLKKIRWNKVFSARQIKIVEPEQRNGNITIFELAVICTAVRNLTDPKLIIEIGTFDGRTTLNLAVNSPPKTKIVTLDLPPNEETKFELAPFEEYFVNKPVSGERFVDCPTEMKPYAKKISQVYGDSAAFDWSDYFGKADLVFIDGSHAYDYVVCDTKTALKLIKPTGIIIWHDYGEWDGVTKALNQFFTNGMRDIVIIKSSTLVTLNNNNIFKI